MKALKQIAIAFVTLAVLAPVMTYLLDIDWGFLNSQITHYSAQCGTPVVNGYCANPAFPTNPTTYRVDAEHQTVVYKTADFNVNRLIDCAVINRSNWTCKNSDRSAELGFNNGSFFERSLGQASDFSKDFDAKSYDLSHRDYIRWQWFGKEAFYDRKRF